MTIKEYLDGKKLIAVETVNSLIVNLITEKEGTKGLLVDTSSVLAHTPLVRKENFTLTKTKLSVDDISLDIKVVEVL